MKNYIEMTSGQNTYTSIHQWETIEDMLEYAYNNPDMDEFPGADADSGETCTYRIVE